MNEINRERLTDTFVSLVGIDSLSYGERAFADELTRRLKQLGFEVTEDDAGARIGGNAGNLFAKKASNIPQNTADAILFSAHMDTVAPGIGKKPILHWDGKITSDGTTVLGADDAGGIAEILEAVEEVLEENLPRPDIELFFPVAEEAYCIGSHVFDLSGVKAKRAYFLDRSGAVGSVTTSEPSLYKFSIEVTGKASHAGFDPEKGVNAILIASRSIAELPVGRVEEDTTLAIGLIQGGTATNIVPDHVRVEGEIRSRSDAKAQGIRSLIEKTFLEQAEALGGAIKVEFTKHLSAYQVPQDATSLKAYQEVLRDLEIPYAPEDSFGGSDTNAFRAGGIDAICIANAMHEIHTTAEYTSVEEMAAVTRIVKKLLHVEQ